MDKLTRRQREILEVVCAGGTNKEAAYRLFLSTQTVKNYLTDTYRCLGVRDRGAACFCYGQWHGASDAPTTVPDVTTDDV